MDICLNQNEWTALDILNVHPRGMSIKELANEMGIREGTAQKALNHLVDMGHVIEKTVEGEKIFLPKN